MVVSMERIEKEMLDEDFVCGFQGMDIMAQWLSWLERRPVTAKVTGSNPVWVVRFLFPCD